MGQYAVINDDAYQTEDNDTSYRGFESLRDGDFESPSRVDSLPYSSGRQVRSVIKRRIWDFLWTVLFVFLIVVILQVWEYKGAVSTSQVTIFNLLSTILSIALGLNLSEAFKGLATILRWKILAQKRHSVRETDLILGSDSFRNVFTLARSSFAKAQFWTLSLCSSWILLFLCAQATVSLVSLTYAFNAGTYVTDGPVVAPDLSDYAPVKPGAEPAPEGRRQGLAHSYGQLTFTSTEWCGNYTTIEDVLNSKVNYEYYCNRAPGHQEFAYRYLEWDPKDAQRTYPWMTDRVITTSSGPCRIYNETHNKLGPARKTYFYSNGTSNGTIEIPYSYENNGATTYIYRGWHEPAIAEQQRCGPRCLWMWAHRAWSKAEPSTFYECPITISNVSNTNDDPLKQVPDSMAYLAAASIAVDGKHDSTGNWTQWQFVPFATHWEIHHQSTDLVGANIAEFALGSLAFMASRNPKPITMNGNLTHVGQKLDPHWQSAIPLLSAVVAAHFALFVAAVYTSRSVIIKDNTPLAVARLLRPLVDTVGNTGATMSGKELSAQISKTGQFQEGVVYGPKMLEGKEGYQLDLASDVRPLDQWYGGRHPDGFMTG
ncbi:hypothetical protein ACLMJK_000599 [Lecanora helva]